MARALPNQSMVPVKKNALPSNMRKIHFEEWKEPLFYFLRQSNLLLLHRTPHEGSKGGQVARPQIKTVMGTSFKILYISFPFFS